MAKNVMVTPSRRTSGRGFKGDGFRELPNSGLKVAVTFPDEIYWKIRRISKERDVSFASVVRELLSSALEGERE